jgi:hypothetical protein
MGSTAGSTVVSIGNGEGTVFVVPAYHYYKHNWSQLIYLQSEINTAGNITKIRFQVDPASPVSYTATNQKIYMAHTTYATFPSVAVKENAQTNYASSSYTLVYDGTIVWIPGWVEIVLQTPFAWNNIDNLLIKYENRSGGWSASYPGFYYTSKTATVGYQYLDASYPTSDGTRDGFRPNIKLLISDPTPLPIELSSFDGVTAGPHNKLFWETFTENNTSHYNIQKSRDGENWLTVATVGAAGNSTHKIDYSIVDYNVEPIINYYRLQQYDLNGVYDTFGPIAINNMNLTSIKKVIAYVNLNGQTVDPSKLNSMDVYIEIYEDGTMRKIIK